MTPTDPALDPAMETSAESDAEISAETGAGASPGAPSGSSGGGPEHEGLPEGEQAADGALPSPARDEAPDSAGAPEGTPVERRSALALAAMASIAVRGLDPARLALPQLDSAHLRVVGVIDTRGRHWEVHEALDDITGAELVAEAEVLRRIGRIVDGGRLSFDVPRPAGFLRRDGACVQVRSHTAGRPINLMSLRPGPGLSAGLGKALGELHELPTTVISEAGMPVRDADEVRDSWLALLDEAAGTGKAPSSVLSRWERALEDAALWRFRPVVVHGDMAAENVLTAGGSVVAMSGFGQAHVGDPAEDLAWIYSSAPLDCLDSIESAYDLARSEGVDCHLRDRAELVSEMSLARWLLHGVHSGDESVTRDAVAMLEDLAEQVGDDPIVAHHEPRLAPVPTDSAVRAADEMEAVTSEVPAPLRAVPSPGE
ncbi:phosphotransferase [Actinomyces sp. zg296]|uniref:phosphotransferase n=1 Tax=Actinomyces sp. zg296 TaxID=2609289 RepID=UPI00135A255C|nr:phosphotransferase [Actinomyces sp. zg296]